MNGPKYITFDRDGSVLVADAENNVIRRFTPIDGRITRVAGTGLGLRASAAIPCVRTGASTRITIAPDGVLPTATTTAFSRSYLDPITRRYENQSNCPFVTRRDHRFRRRNTREILVAGRRSGSK
jgi:hypothetical protein